MSSLKTLRTYSHLIEAEGARAYLEAHQIEAVMPDRYALYHQPHLTEVLGGIRLQVSESQYERADQLLKSIEQRSHLTSISPEEVPPHFERGFGNFSENRRQIATRWFMRGFVFIMVSYWVYTLFYKE